MLLQQGQKKNFILLVINAYSLELRVMLLMKHIKYLKDLIAAINIVEGEYEPSEYFRIIAQK